MIMVIVRMMIVMVVIVRKMIAMRIMSITVIAMMGMIVIITCGTVPIVIMAGIPAASRIMQHVALAFTRRAWSVLAPPFRV